VDLVSGRTLNVTGTLTLRGVQGGPAPEREWDGDGLRVVHQAPPEPWPGLGESPVQASVYRLRAEEGGDDLAGPEPAGEAGAAQPAGDGADAVRASWEAVADYAAGEASFGHASSEAVAAPSAADEANAARTGGDAVAAYADAVETVFDRSGADESGPAQPAAGASPAADYAKGAAADAGAAVFGAVEGGEARTAAGETGQVPGSRQPQDAAGSLRDGRGAEPADVRESPVSEPSIVPEEPVASAGAGSDEPAPAAAHPGEEAFAARETEPAAWADAASGETDDAAASEYGLPVSAPDASAAEERPSVKVTLTGKREPAATGASAEAVGWHSLIGLRAEKREAATGPGAEEREAGTAGDAAAAGGEGQADLRTAGEPIGEVGAIPAAEGEEVTAPEKAAEPAGGDELDWARLFRFRGSEASPFTRVRLCIVQEDESLESVAERYRVQARLLQRFNNLSEPYVTKGQGLYIP